MASTTQQANEILDQVKHQERQQLLDILASDTKTFEQCLQQFNNKFSRH